MQQDRTRSEVLLAARQVQTRGEEARGITGRAEARPATGETPVGPVSRQDGGSPYGRDKRGR